MLEGSREKANAIEFAYIAKADGRKAVIRVRHTHRRMQTQSHSPTDAFHIPALKSIKNIMYRPAL